MGERAAIAFEEIKCRLIRPPVLHLPNSTGRFHLYSDTNKFATGSAQVFKLCDSLLGWKKEQSFPPRLNNQELTDTFSKFFHH